MPNEPDEPKPKGAANRLGSDAMEPAAIPDRPDQPDQIAYLSNRPEILAETLSYVGHFMPWVREAVVLSPSTSVPLLRRAVAGVGGPSVSIVDETELLSDAERDRLPAAHSARNAYLRRAFVSRGPLADVFIQSDDDYRPLRPVPPETFVEGGRLHSYACHDLALWRRNSSTFDEAQHASYLALNYLGAPHLLYASHMPQAIDRRLYLQAFDAALALDPSAAFCEWSLPLNHGRLVAPERFHAPRTFRTMCWPRYPHEWPFWRRPEELTFENFHPELYTPGGLFAGIATQLAVTNPQQQAFQKIQRWYNFDLEAGSLRFVPGVDDPWRTGASPVSSFLRRRFFSAARRGRRYWEYVALEERTQLMQLAGESQRRGPDPDPPRSAVPPE
ncbi:hypothetical protein [Jatrophihabitans sp. GAS493]|uniref:hypothetical protein n=1 Tax=Jatrophihabitans sp. GAS493 TaxID=1907575 RepID=UPI000BB900DC|nr:hypothetical protein [Jatrophihabitans sp. GAS493]